MEKKLNIVLILAYIGAIILTFLIFRPFLAFMIFGMVLIMFLFPVNLYLKKYMQNNSIRSLFMTFLTLIIIIIPLFLIASSVVDEARTVYSQISNLDLDEATNTLSEYTGFELDLEEQILPVLIDFRDFLTGSITEVVSYAAELLIKLFVLLFVLYYGFKEGEKIVEKIKDLLPFSKTQKQELVESVTNVIKGVLYGQFLVAVLQGIVGGLTFWAFGLPNPIFWGFIMAILSFIPLLGPPIVWVPAVIISFYQGNLVAAIGILLVGVLIIMNIDNILKPKIIGDKVGLHPLIILIGILGGIALFGVIGFIIGPITLALSLIIIKFFNEEHLIN
ncbi:MAG: AI-2E family transporter [Candidatus Woesearchaeota archaeon]